MFPALHNIQQMASDNASELLEMLQEIEGLLQLPDVPEHTVKARRLALSVARRSRRGEVANLAMILYSQIVDLDGRTELRSVAVSQLQTALDRIRSAL